MKELNFKQAMYIAWFMAVTRKIEISSNESSDDDYKGHSKNISNLYQILKDENWGELNISKEQEIQISEQSHFIYLNKFDEVKWAADNLYLSRIELEGVGSLISEPVKFESNLLIGPNCLKSFI
tara:strand:- start:24 stop:395 length:372 start_codon:yes stop_codon:yes gene_type:complete